LAGRDGPQRILAAREAAAANLAGRDSPQQISADHFLGCANRQPADPRLSTRGGARQAGGNGEGPGEFLNTGLFPETTLHARELSVQRCPENSFP
jgi:hypothetical protein